MKIGSSWQQAQIILILKQHLVVHLILLLEPQLLNDTFTFNIVGTENTSWTVYSSADLKNWTPVGQATLNYNGSSFDDANGSSSFTDNQVNGVSCRFYKLRNGSCCSRVIGFYQVQAAPGFTPGANQLDVSDPSQNTLLNVFAHISPSPQASDLAVWEQNTCYTWNGINWLDSAGQTTTLNPGEGAFIQNNTSSSFTVTYIGYVREGHLVNPLPANAITVVSSMVPQAGGVISQLGYQPTSGANGGDIFYIWMGNGWRSDMAYFSAADATAWEDDGTSYPAGLYDLVSGTQLPEPTLNLGGIICILPVGSNENWTRDFNPCFGP